VVESLLAMNGIGITKIDDQFFKAVPAANMNVHVPIWLDGPASAIKPNQNIYTKMFYLEHMTVEQMREILNPFATPNVSTLLVYPKADAILITDSLLNLQRMEKMIEKMDKVPEENITVFSFALQNSEAKSFLDETLAKGFAKESLLGKQFHVIPSFGRTGTHSIRITCHKNDETRIRKILEMLDFEWDLGLDFEIVTLKHALAADIEELLQKFKGMDMGPVAEQAPSQPQTGKGGTPEVSRSNYEARNGYFSSRFTFFADERSNSIIIGGLVSDVALAKARIKDLDIPVDYASDLISLRFATAEKVVEILRELSRVSEQQAKSPQATAVAKPSVGNTGGAQAKASDGGKLSESFAVTADPRTNSVFVSGTSYDVELAREKIKLLDKSLPMAQIDTIFVMVTLTGNTSRGIDLFSNAFYEKSGGGTIEDPQSGTSRDVPAGESLSFNANIPGFGGPITFGFLDSKLNNVAWNNIFKIAQASTDSRVFSSPSIVVSHSQEQAEISMKNKRTVFSQSSYNSTTGGQSNFSNDKEFTSETSLFLTKPKVSLPTIDVEGNKLPGAVHTEVKLITSNFDDLAASNYNGQTVPATQSREVETLLTIKDNQIIALGGLQQVNHSRSENQYGILRKIPFLGKSLFSPRSENYEPSELLIFIRVRVFQQEDGSISTPMNSFQPRKIDSMMTEHYVPHFQSPNPSKKITSPNSFNFGGINTNKTSAVDRTSEKPVF
jgi:type II secretory pathway component GspD/PulD (secretin)